MQENVKKIIIIFSGGTGFLGKILIEKLLRSCPEISTIYLLVRGKKGKNVEERIEDLFNDSVSNDRLCENISNSYEKCLNFVVPRR